MLLNGGDFGINISTSVEWRHANTITFYTLPYEWQKQYDLKLLLFITSNSSMLAHMSPCHIRIPCIYWFVIDFVQCMDNFFCRNYLIFKQSKMLECCWTWVILLQLIISPQLAVLPATAQLPGTLLLEGMYYTKELLLNTVLTGLKYLLFFLNSLVFN